MNIGLNFEGSRAARRNMRTSVHKGRNPPNKQNTAKDTPAGLATRFSDRWLIKNNRMRPTYGTEQAARTTANGRRRSSVPLLMACIRYVSPSVSRCEPRYASA